MKTITAKSLCVLLLLCAGASHAGNLPVAPPVGSSPDTSGFTLGAEIGDFWVPSLTLGAPLSVEMKFKSGWGFDVPVGYDFGNGLAVSISAGYDKVNFQSLTGILDGQRQSASTSGTMALYPVMANASYSFKLVGNLSWNLGGGVGAVYNKTSFKTFDNDSEKSITFGQLGHATAVFGGMEDSSWNFGFQAFTGLSYKMMSSASLNLGYHYLHTNDKLSVNGESSSPIVGHMAVLGLEWKF